MTGASRQFQGSIQIKNENIKNRQDGKGKMLDGTKCCDQPLIKINKFKLKKKSKKLHPRMYN